jgi:lysozyme
MLKRIMIVIGVVAVLCAALFLGIKAGVIRPNMIFVPEGVKGVDISEYQGAVDFEGLSSAGIEFVYAKATEGATYVDGQFAATCEQAKGSDVALGAYHFFSFDSPGSDQAENFIASAKASWSDPAIRALRPAVDVEWYGDKEQNPPVTEDVHRELRAFVDGVEAACGQKPLIYAGNDIYDRYLRGYFDDCELWIACRKWPAWVEWPRGGWTIWQYSDTGELAGALNEAGHVDLDVLAEGVSVEDLAVSPKSYR